MTNGPRAAALLAALHLAVFTFAQQTPPAKSTNRCERQPLPPVQWKAPESTSPVPYGGAALAVGAFGLFARRRR